MEEPWSIFLQYPVYMKNEDCSKIIKDDRSCIPYTNDMVGPAFLSLQNCIQDDFPARYDYLSKIKNVNLVDMSVVNPDFTNPINNQLFKQDDVLFNYPGYDVMDAPSMQDLANRNDYLYLQHAVFKDHLESNNAIAPGSDNWFNIQEFVVLNNSSEIKENSPIYSNVKQNVCFNCGVNETPLWRRSPDKKYLLCNACGLYLKQYKYMRPLGFCRKKSSNSQLKPSIKMVCVNCQVSQTSLWRKNESGNPICNACRLYEKLHNTQRPVTMRKEHVVRRKRYKNLLGHYYNIEDVANISNDKSAF